MEISARLLFCITEAVKEAGALHAGHGFFSEQGAGSVCPQDHV